MKGLGTSWGGPGNRARESRRSGMVYVLVVVLVFLMSALLIALYTQFIAGVRQVSRITSESTQFYMAEAVLSRTLNLIKKKAWADWAAALAEPRIDYPTYRGADCCVVIDTVKDAKGEVVPAFLDVFVRVDHEGYRLNYVHRVRLRDPSVLRPTEIEIRRQARLPDDVDDSAGRARAIATLEQDERDREHNRPATNVNVRYLLAVLDAGASLKSAAYTVRQIQRQEAPPTLPGQPWARWIVEVLGREFRPRSAWARIATEERLREQNRVRSNILERLTPDSGADVGSVVRALTQASYAAEVDKERAVLDKIREGDTILFADPPDSAGLIQSRDLYQSALETSRNQSAVNALQNEPRALYRLARCKTAMAETLAFDEVEARENRCVELVSAQSGPPSRTQLLEDVDKIYEDITTRFPDSSEAPHAYIPWAWAQMKRVTPTNPAAWNAARACAYRILETLRDRYPLYHLWHEDAITSHPDSPGTPAPPTDEVVYYVENLIEPLMVFGRRVQPGDPDPDALSTSPLLYLSSMDFSKLQVLSPALKRAHRSQGTSTWSPDGTQVIFPVRRREGEDTWDLVGLDLADPAGRLRILAPGSRYGATYSPDGTRLLMSPDRDGNRNVTSRAVDGSDERRLTDDSAGAVDAHWSPDGRHIVYISGSSLAGRSIWEMDADGGNKSQVVATEPGWTYNIPCYSPDGTEIGFNRWSLTGAGPWPDSRAWMIGRDGSNRRSVTPEGFHAAPWSPDGKSRLYGKLNDDVTEGSEIWISTADGSNLRPFGEEAGGSNRDRFGQTLWWCSFNSLSPR